TGGLCHRVLCGRHQEQLSCGIRVRGATGTDEVRHHGRVRFDLAVPLVHRGHIPGKVFVLMTLATRVLYPELPIEGGPRYGDGVIGPAVLQPRAYALML